MEVPFYKNTDNTHCFQAVLRMILGYYWPNKDFTWQELEKFTAKVDALWTWPTAGILWLHDNGFEVHGVEAFDYRKFIDEGGDYLIGLFGDEVGQEQIAHSDIGQEIDYARHIAKADVCESRIPDISELKKRLDEKSLLICNVNSRVLNNKEGYSGHFVLLTSYTDHGFVMHDPGLPSFENREVIFANFERAWAYPDERAKNYIAVRRKI